MARSIRYIIPNFHHHAIQWGNNRQNIFIEERFSIYMKVRGRGRPGKVKK